MSADQAPSEAPAKRRKQAALLVAGAALVAALVRVLPIAPSLDITVFRTARNPLFEKYSVVAVVRGGEAIDEVSIERVSGPVRVLGNAVMPNLRAAWKVNFEVILDGGGAETGVVRVVQKGSGARTYDVVIGEAPR